MNDAFPPTDELGPAAIHYLAERKCGLEAIVVVDNLACGPSIGGIRMAPDVSLEECRRLARAMTLKNACAGLPHGGGKSVIFGDPRMPAAQKERVIRAFAGAIRGLREYIPGPDMGTDERCMAWIKDEIDRAVGLPSELGGIPLDEIGATGFGLAACIEVAKGYAGFELKGARIAIQGFGAVGKHAARFLAEKGAVLVAVSDSAGTLRDPRGIDVARLIELKGAGRTVLDHPEGKKGDLDSILDVECEVWIPAARPDVLARDNVGRIRTKLVAQGANIPATAEAERMLHERGILSVPDFVANAGGVICAAVEHRGGSRSQAFETIAEKVRSNVENVLREATRTKQPPRAVALALAEARVRRAMALRRW